MRRRQTSVFSLAFLDCICCGFGAVILIFVLSIDSKEKEKMQTLLDLRDVLARQLQQLAKLATSKEDLERSNLRVSTLVTDARIKNDSTHALLDDLEGKIQYEKRGQEALLVDIDELKKELAARQKKPEALLKETEPTPLGLPIGSNHVAIVIDTSGSMRDGIGNIWPIAIRKVDELLDAYPDLQGIQIIDADGRFLMGQPRGTAPSDSWLKDTPEVRADIKRTLRRNSTETASNPVFGIYAAIRRLYDKNDPDMKMAIYVFGDEFVETADPVIKRLDELNPADEAGHRRIVINAIGFPTRIQDPLWGGNTSIKFANLMRTVTYIHGGAFIALQDL